MRCRFLRWDVGEREGGIGPPISLHKDVKAINSVLQRKNKITLVPYIIASLSIRILSGLVDRQRDEGGNRPPITERNTEAKTFPKHADFLSWCLYSQVPSAAAGEAAWLYHNHCYITVK